MKRSEVQQKIESYLRPYIGDIHLKVHASKLLHIIEETGMLPPTSLVKTSKYIYGNDPGYENTKFYQTEEKNEWEPEDA